MKAIFSTAINFRNTEDVKAYMGLSPAALPDTDRRFDNVATYKVGFNYIVLLDADGYVIAKVARMALRGFAIDNQPIAVNGPEFKRIGCDDMITDAEKEELYKDLDEVKKSVDDAIAAGMKYRVSWVSFMKDDNNKSIRGHMDFKTKDEAEKELDARLSTEKEAILIDLK